MGWWLSIPDEAKSQRCSEVLTVLIEEEDVFMHGARSLVLRSRR